MAWHIVSITVNNSHCFDNKLKIDIAEKYEVILKARLHYFAPNEETHRNSLYSTRTLIGNYVTTNKATR